METGVGAGTAGTPQRWSPRPSLPAPPPGSAPDTACRPLSALSRRDDVSGSARRRVPASPPWRRLWPISTTRTWATSTTVRAGAGRRGRRRTGEAAEGPVADSGRGYGATRPWLAGAAWGRSPRPVPGPSGPGERWLGGSRHGPALGPALGLAGGWCFPPYPPPR